MEHCNILTEQIDQVNLKDSYSMNLENSTRFERILAFPKPLIEKFLHTIIFLSYKILCIVSDMYSAPYKRITSSTFILHCPLFYYLTEHGNILTEQIDQVCPFSYNGRYIS
jgi:hypothetical protein